MIFPAALLRDTARAAAHASRAGQLRNKRPQPSPRARSALALQLNGWVLGEWKWAEFQGLPQTTIKTDIHCVTKWSKLDTIWQGVGFDDLLKAVDLGEAPFPYIMARCDGGYTTDLPVADLIGGKGMIATRYDGSPIPPRTAAQPGCLCHISTFGRAPNGCGDCGS